MDFFLILHERRTQAGQGGCARRAVFGVCAAGRQGGGVLVQCRCCGMRRALRRHSRTGAEGPQGGGRQQEPGRAAGGGWISGARGKGEDLAKRMTE